MLSSLLQILYSETFTVTASVILSLKNIYTQVLNHAVQIKLLQDLNNDSRAFCASSLGFHWRMKTTSIPCSIGPISYLQTGAEKQEQTCTERPGLVCAQNILASRASGCDVTQMAKNSTNTTISLVWGNASLEKCRLVTARRDTLQMIPVGRIPQHNPQPQRDARSSGPEILRTRQNFITRELPNSCLAIDAEGGGVVSVSFSHSTALSCPELVWLRVAWMSPLSSDLIHRLKCFHPKCWSCSIFKCLHHPLTLRRETCKKSAKTGTSLQFDLHRLCPSSHCERSTKHWRKVQRGTENPVESNITKYLSFHFPLVTFWNYTWFYFLFLSRGVILFLPLFFFWCLF